MHTEEGALGVHAAGLEHSISLASWAARDAKHTLIACRVLVASATRPSEAQTQ
jgi:hypothetical protein